MSEQTRHDPAGSIGTSAKPSGPAPPSTTTDPSTKPLTVTVFGAGVAGLTAAHELAERGFEVKVVEPTPSLDFDEYCEVGGLAQSQWSHAPVQHRLRSGFGDMKEAPKCVGVPQVMFFEPTIDADPPEKHDPPPTEPAKYVPEHTGSRSYHLQPDATNATKLKVLARDLITGAETYLTKTTGATLDRCDECNECNECNDHERCPRCSDCCNKSACKSYNLVLDVTGHCDADRAPEVARQIGFERATNVIAALKTELNDVHKERRTKDGTKDETAVAPEDMIELVAHTRGSEDGGDNTTQRGRRWSNRVDFRVFEIRLPGEHGYRFFPRCYRHIDDVMRRIPLYDGGHEMYRSALDNLHELSDTAFARSNGSAPIPILRHKPGSLAGALHSMGQMHKSMDAPPLDIVKLQLKFLKYMTSSSQRRAAECEDVSWWDYVQGDQYSAAMQRILKATPQALVAMSATETDARTNGNMSVQFMMDQLSDGKNVDRTLNGPTSESWLRPWKYYLKRQGVRFFRGALDSLELKNDKEDVTPRLRPIVSAVGGYASESPEKKQAVAAEVKNVGGVFDRSHGVAQDDEPDRNPDTTSFDEDDYYVLALPPVAAQKVVQPVEDKQLNDTLKTLKHYDFDGAMGNMVGIQFYFQNRFDFFNGHTFFADSAWRLTSISQLQFWNTPRNLHSGYLGVLSVDIGDMKTRDTSVARWLAIRAQYWAEKATPGASSEMATQAAKAALEACNAFSFDLTTSQKAAVQKIYSTVVPRYLFLDSVHGVSLPAIPVLQRKKLEELMTQVEGQLPPALDDAMRVGAKAFLEDSENESLVQAGWHAMATVGALELGKTAWKSTASEIANTTWSQIKLGLDMNVAETLPDPIYFSIDHTMSFDPDTGLPTHNGSPLQINRKGKFRHRPGVLPTPPGQPDSVYYELWDGWVLAGMITKTHTRLTTMEQSCESGRHAVNAILDSIVNPDPKTLATSDVAGSAGEPGHVLATDVLHSSLKGYRYGDYCAIYDPENNEIPDLGFLKDIDDRLLDEGLPHFLDILGIEDAVDRAHGTGGGEPLDQLRSLLNAWSHVTTKIFHEAGIGGPATASAAQPVRQALEQIYGPELTKAMLWPWEQLASTATGHQQVSFKDMFDANQAHGLTETLKELFQNWHDQLERSLMNR